MNEQKCAALQALKLLYWTIIGVKKKKSINFFHLALSIHSFDIPKAQNVLEHWLSSSIPSWIDICQFLLLSHLLHMLWACPQISEYWTKIFETLQKCLPLPRMIISLEHCKSSCLLLCWLPLLFWKGSMFEPLNLKIGSRAHWTSLLRSLWNLFFSHNLEALSGSFKIFEPVHVWY